MVRLEYICSASLHKKGGMIFIDLERLFGSTTFIDNK